VVTVRAYEELNDYLAPGRRKRPFAVEVPAGTAVRDLLAGLGIPASEVDLVLIDGRPEGLDAALAGRERVAAYPVFEAFDVGTVSPIPGRPLRCPRFFADEHLARLGRYLRLAGFDVRMEPGLDDRALVDGAEAEERVLLTRDRHLVDFLRPSRVVVPRASRPAEQFVEVIRRLQLESLARPFTRCMVCNACLDPIEKADLPGDLPARVRDGHEVFLGCSGCGRVYWPGSHHRRMSRLLGIAGIRFG
jgi:uncharacterized protein with PIN domain